MKGVARTVQLLLCSSTLARRLLGIGLVLTGLGLAALLGGWRTAAMPLFFIALIVGMPAAVIVPVLLGPPIFRSFSAPRANWLIPGGRLKLLLGALCTQLLLALFIAGVVTTMLHFPRIPQPATDSDAHRFVTQSIVAFAALSANFIGYYWASQYSFGGLWLIGFAQLGWLLNTAFAQTRLRLPFTPTHLTVLLAMSLGAWLLFAVTYLRARQVRAPHRNNAALTTTVGVRSAFGVRSTFYAADLASRGPQGYSQQDAIGLLLSGTPRSRRGPVARSLLVLSLVAGYLILAALVSRFHGFNGDWPAVAGIGCLFTGPVAWGNVGRLANRSKSLWLAAGLDRAELFRQIELRSWRVVLGLTALGITVVVLWFALNLIPLRSMAPPLATNWLVGLLVMPLASGAMSIYAGLQYVRGRRLLDVVILFGSLTLWFLGMMFVMVGAQAQTLSVLLAIQIILCAPLRALALRRWQNIDWLIFKPVR